MVGFNPGLSVSANPGFNPGELPAFDGGGVGETMIKSIQQIEFAVASASLTGTDTITEVDVNKTVIFFGYGSVTGGVRTTSNTAFLSLTGVRVDLTNSTTVTATRGATGADLTIICTVVEYNATIVSSVQQGTVAISTGTSATDTITSVDTTRSIALYNGTEFDTGSASGDGLAEISLTNATTVTASRGVSSSNTATAAYVVIEFAAGIVDSVQEVSITIAGSSASNTATITSVDTAISCIFPGGNATNDTSIIASESISDITITNATTITSTRGTSPATTVTIAGTIVEFAAGKTNSIQRGTIAVSGATSGDDTITAVVTALSVVNGLGTSSTNTNFLGARVLTTTEIVNTTTVRVKKEFGTGAITPRYEVVEYI